MKNKDAIELYNLLSSLKNTPNSPREYSVAKTLRKMKPFIEWYNDKVEDIKMENCLVKEENGKQILIKETIKISKGDSTEEVLVPAYDKTGEKNKKDAIRALNEQEVGVKFDIHQTNDASDLTAYERESLIELGFLKQPE